MNVIQQQLGHSNISTTHVYLCKIAPQQVIETMQGREWSL
jgi:site-specific recombinase XerD